MPCQTSTSANGSDVSITGSRKPRVSALSAIAAVTSTCEGSARRGAMTFTRVVIVCSPNRNLFVGATQFTDGVGAADFLRAGECRVAVVEGSQERAFALRADAIGLRYGRGPRIEGINISGGRRVSLALFRAERY